MPENKEYKVEPVPYIAHESAMAREERKEKNLVKALVLVVLLLFASNALWLWAWTSYEYIGEEVTVESKDKGNARRDSMGRYSREGGSSGIGSYRGYSRAADEEVTRNLERLMNQAANEEAKEGYRRLLEQM